MSGGLRGGTRLAVQSWRQNGLSGERSEREELAERLGNAITAPRSARRVKGDKSRLAVPLATA